MSDRPPPLPSAPPAQRTPPTRKTANKLQRWMRWLHVYASMVAFLVIMFFGVTGILLNHPTWLFGDQIATTFIEGTLPDTVRSGESSASENSASENSASENSASENSVEFLAVSEYLRSEHGVGGEVTNFDQIDDEGSINYTGPGYGASVRFDVISLSYELTIREEGFVNAMRDLHSGSDTGSVWSLVIDVASVFLVFVAVTGLGIQLLMRKRRKSALLWLAGGATITAALIWFTLV